MKKWTPILLALALTFSAAPAAPAAHAADSTASIVSGTAKTLNYGMVGSLSEGLASFWNESSGLYGYTDTNGKAVIKAQYQEVKPFSEGLAAVRKGKLWGFVDKKGKVVIKPQYERIVEGFNGGLAAVKKTGGKWIYIDKTGRVKITAAYDEVHDFKDGMAIVWKRKGSAFLGGFIDKSGKEVIKPQYAMLSIFSEGLAAVKVGGSANDRSGKWGYIGVTGKMVIPAQYTNENAEVGSFKEGVAFVQRPDYGKLLIDRFGKVVVDLKTNNIAVSEFENGAAVVNAPIGSGQYYFMKNPIAKK
ncbi:WG repeat-containing protein [Saccharibacillus kuerlensis]|uniref:WG repeat-containing protein n=1 Tax=Saccharibacillus kuerlensis TaxID=459527 RepID=A0ABQ2L0C2_9BACL|nr:WG repeat-containing protein [Saccharibacillus kuerlensis]GGN98430.1 hypothetical protein GCM10010969_17560 [Saccharibacillus kuerlensis]